MKYQDIHLEDKDKWAQFQSLYQAGSYAEAIALLEETQLALKSLTATNLNDLTNFITQVEGLNDPSFKTDKIPCQTAQPSQNVGEVWFQIIE